MMKESDIDTLRRLLDLAHTGRAVGIAWVAVMLAGCASTGVVPMDRDTFMIAKKSAGGLFVTGDEVKADLYTEAAAHCAKTGQAVETIKAEGKNAIPFARTPQATLEFRCVNK